MNFRRSLTPLLLFVLVACSSKKSKNSDALVDSEPESGSSADSVGSIPEDLVESKEGSAVAKEGDLPLDQNSALPSNGEKDPFSDITAKSESGGAAALSVIENGESGNNSAATTGEMDTYKVKSGDTLMKIAFSIYGDIDRWNDLKSWNDATLKKGLRTGMKLKFEKPVEPFSPNELAHSYTIKKGDTLAGIADDVYGRRNKYKKLQKYNAKLIRNPNRIFAGFNIFYDITEKEIAEAEARKQEKVAKDNSPISPEVSAPSNPAPASAAAAPNQASREMPPTTAAAPAPKK